ncbi:hypothetical protein [Endozoicomonas sp. Mp262]|uniref:hypothetical protein n=1 Tax=Endozoicomonas sp. Mp262 TaxID=2919499 RepID=UPI0021D853D3
MMHCNFIDNDNAGLYRSKHRFQANPISWLSRMISSIDLQSYTKPSNPLKKLPDTKLVQRETVATCTALDDQQIKLLEAIAFLNIKPGKDDPLNDSTAIQDNLIELIKKESQKQGIDPAKMTENQFKKLLKEVMKDLNKRGINIGNKTLEKGSNYKRCLTRHKKNFPKYCEDYEKICACDKIMDEYIATCKKTSGDYWVYRYDYSEMGGKLIRNIKKGKMPFRSSYSRDIN